MAAAGSRLLILLVTLVLLGSALAGCFERDRGKQTADGDDDQLYELFITIAGVDAPTGSTEAIVNLTVDRLSLYDTDTEEWVDLLVAEASALVVFEDGVSDPAPLTRVPITLADYDSIEIIVSSARVTSETGTVDAEVPQLACYAPVDLGQPGADDTIDLELWMSGPDALERTATGWRFQPALIGSVSGSDEGGADLVDPECRPY